MTNQVRSNLSGFRKLRLKQKRLLLQQMHKSQTKGEVEMSQPSVDNLLDSDLNDHLEMIIHRGAL